MIAKADDPRLGTTIGRRLTRRRPARIGGGPAVRAGEGDDLGIVNLVPWLVARFMPRRPLVAAWGAASLETPGEMLSARCGARRDPQASHQPALSEEVGMRMPRVPGEAEGNIFLTPLYDKPEKAIGADIFCLNTHPQLPIQVAS